MAKLWVFGDSHATAWGLPDDSLSWPHLLSDRLGLELEDHARVSADNGLIYCAIMHAADQIDHHRDRVIIAWSHPNRISFEFDPHNPRHQAAADQSLIYDIADRRFFRSNGPKRMIGFQTMRKLAPCDSGIEFYDRWYRDYFSEYQQRLSFQAYHDSVNMRLPHSIKFYFSRNSIENIRVNDTEPRCMLDFVIDNQLYLDPEDLHPNAQAHGQWADLLYHDIIKGDPYVS